MTLEDYPVDDDYIGVEEEAADVSQSKDGYRLDLSHTYDRSDTAMSGSDIDVKFDRRPVTDRDERGGTRTGFDAGDTTLGRFSDTIIREGKQYTRAKWLRLLNDGYRAPERKAENEQTETDAYLSTFAARLELSDYQANRLEAIIESVAMDEFGPYPKEVIILASMSVVANEDDRWLRDEDAFKQLVSDLDSSMEDVKNARLLVKRKSPLL